MKSKITICFLLLSAAIFAQDDQTLFDDVNRIGGWGGPLFEYTNLDKDVEVNSGGGGALILDDFFLGGYGMGNSELSKVGVLATDEVNFKHGGFWIGYVPLQGKVVHPYLSARFGWGKARYKQKALNDPDLILAERRDNIFVMTPEVGFELNIFSFFRIAATGSYRLVNGLDDVPNFTDDELSGFGGTLTLRFGGFGNSSNWD